LWYNILFFTNSSSILSLRKEKIMNKVHKAILYTIVTIAFFTVVVFLILELHSLMIKVTQNKEAIALSVMIPVISYAFGKFLEYTISKLISLSKLE